MPGAGFDYYSTHNYSDAYSYPAAAYYGDAYACSTAADNAFLQYHCAAVDTVTSTKEATPGTDASARSHPIPALQSMATVLPSQPVTTAALSIAEAAEQRNSKFQGVFSAKENVSPSAPTKEKQRDAAAKPRRAANANNSKSVAEGVVPTPTQRQQWLLNLGA
jgi:hypothetical protein